MTALQAWAKRPREFTALLPPGFIAVSLARATLGYSQERSDGPPPPIPLVAVVPALALHGPTRAELPRSVATSLPVWLKERRHLRASLTVRARELAPFVREALRLGSSHGLFRFENGGLVVGSDAKKKVNGTEKNATAESLEILKRSTFLGRWLARGGTPSTVLMMLGVGQ